MSTMSSLTPSTHQKQMQSWNLSHTPYIHQIYSMVKAGGISRKVKANETLNTYIFSIMSLSLVIQLDNQGKSYGIQSHNDIHILMACE